MEIGTILATTGLLATGNYIVWGLKPGEYLYDATRYGNKQYDTYLRPTIERILGLQRKDITAEAMPREDGKMAYRFKNVSIYDLEELQSRLSKSAEKPDLKTRENLLRGAKLEELNAKKEAKDGAHESKQRDPGIESKEKIQYYNINIIAREQNVSLDTIYNPDWSFSDDFNVVVTKEGKNNREGAQLDKNNPEYQLALKTLDRSIKISLDLPLVSDEKISNYIIKSIGGNEIIEFWHDFTKGRINKEHPNQSNDIIKNLLQLTTGSNVADSSNKIEEYYKKIEDILEKELLTTKEIKEKLEKELHRRQEKITREKSKLVAKTTTSLTAAPIIILIAGGFALLSVTSTILLSAVLPEAALLVGIIKAGVTGLLTFINQNFFSGLVGAGMLPMVAGIFTKGIRDYKFKKNALEETLEDLNDIKNTESKLKSDIKNIKSLAHGAIITLNALKRHEDTETLDLSNKDIGDMGVIIACSKYLFEDNVIRTLNLSNNGITSIGAKELANAITNIQTSHTKPNNYLYTIDLTKNNISKDGLAALSDALKSNFTITKLTYEYPNDADKQVILEIHKQLLINYYLQGQKTLYEIQSTIPILETFPEGDMELKEAAIEKLKNNFNITAFPMSNNKEISELAAKVTTQNAHLQELSELISDSTSTSDNLRKILGSSSQAAASEINPGRFIDFLKHHLSREKLSAKRTAIAASSDLETKQKIATLTLFDTAINAGSIDPITLKEQQLNKLLIDPPENSKQAFAEFIEIYKKIPEDKVESVLSRLSKKQVAQLAKPEYTQLRGPDLSKNHIKSLLELCTNSVNPDSQNKIVFLTNILSDEDIARELLNKEYMADFSKKYLNPEAIWTEEQFSYEQIRNALSDIINLQPNNKLTDYILKKLLSKTSPAYTGTSENIIKKLSKSTTPEVPELRELPTAPETPPPPPKKNILAKEFNKILSKLPSPPKMPRFRRNEDPTPEKKSGPKKNI